jgi:hypothetical protein
MDIQHVIINSSHSSKAPQKTIQIPSDTILVEASIELRNIGKQEKVAGGIYGSCIGIYLPSQTYSTVTVDPITGVRGDVTPRGSINEVCAFWYKSEARLADTMYESTPPSIHYYCKQIDDRQLSLFDNALSEETEEVHEGAISFVNHKRYERNPILRKLCLEHYGVQCQICKTRLSDLYGKAIKELIHVHHLTPLSSIANAHSVNPVKDLIPVCPNCHAVIHYRDPPYTPNEVEEMLRKSNRNQD